MLIKEKDKGYFQGNQIIIIDCIIMNKSMRKAFKRNNLLTQESFRKFVMLIENGIGDFTNKINVAILPKSKESIIKEY